jgi:hypothetical protein
MADFGRWTLGFGPHLPRSHVKELTNVYYAPAKK